MSNGPVGQVAAFRLGVVMLKTRFPRLKDDIRTPPAFACAVTDIILIDLDGKPGAGR